MGLFGLIAGLFTASKVHEKIHDDDSGLIEDAFDFGVSSAAGLIVKDVVDDIFDSDDEDDDDNDW